MELREIVNLRKLQEYVDDTLEEERCEFCPFRYSCAGKSEFTLCLIAGMLNEVDDRDLYDIERERSDKRKNDR